MKLNLLYFALCSLLLIGCNQPSKKQENKESEDIVSLTVPPNEIVKSKLVYNPKNSLWTLDSIPFSGYVVSYYQDSLLKQKFGVLNGRKQGKALDWYPDGRLQYTAEYQKGKLHGEKKMWSQDSAHTLLLSYKYQLGKANGFQKKWYPTGEIFKIRQMKDGKEHGIQQAFRENGELYTNYEAKAGRIFGLKRASLCYELKDEKIKRKKKKEQTQ